MGMTPTPAAGRKGGSSPVINMTPLVDVVLVVLIIFMIATLTLTKTFFLNLPPKPETKEDAPKPPPDHKPVVMTVDQRGVIRVNQSVLAKGEIKQRLPRILAGAGQRVLYFDAHDEAPFGTAIEALDLSRASGVKSIAILTEKVVR